MIYTFIAEHCSDLPISTACRVMGVSRSGFYQRRRQPVTDAELAEAWAANTVHDVWTMSRRSYGAPRFRHELRLGLGRRCSKNGCTRRDGTDLNPDRVSRRFDPDGPDRLWVMDVERHEVLLNPAVVKGHRHVPVAAGALKLRAA